MYNLIMIILLILGLWMDRDAILFTSGLFGIAGAIEMFTQKYFKNR